MTFLCNFLLVIEAVFICSMLLKSSAYSFTDIIPSDFLCNFLRSFYYFVSFENLKPKNTLCHIFCCRFFKDEHKLVLYHLYYVATGIMINPIWGLSILSIIAFFIVASLVAIYNKCNADHCRSLLFLQRVGICSAGFLVLCFVITGLVLAGKSFYGRQTADDVLKNLHYCLLLV